MAEAVGPPEREGGIRNRSLHQGSYPSRPTSRVRPAHINEEPLETVYAPRTSQERCSAAARRMPRYPGLLWRDLLPAVRPSLILRGLKARYEHFPACVAMIHRRRCTCWIVLICTECQALICSRVSRLFTTKTLGVSPIAVPCIRHFLHLLSTPISAVISVSSRLAGAYPDEDVKLPSAAAACSGLRRIQHEDESRIYCRGFFLLGASLLPYVTIDAPVHGQGAVSR